MGRVGGQRQVDSLSPACLPAKPQSSSQARWVFFAQGWLGPTWFSPPAHALQVFSAAARSVMIAPLLLLARQMGDWSALALWWGMGTAPAWLAL